MQGQPATLVIKLMKQVIQKMGLFVIQQDFVCCLTSHTDVSLHSALKHHIFTIFKSTRVTITVQNESSEVLLLCFFCCCCCSYGLSLFHRHILHQSFFTPKRKTKPNKSTTKYESSIQAKQKGHKLYLIIPNCGAKPAF